MLTNSQIERYARHIILDGVGGKGQEKLLRSKVLVIGAGGLGSPIAMYLAASGIGNIGIVDFDVVDVSNLQRQIAHSTADIGTPKTDSAERTIKAINPDVAVQKFSFKLTSENIMDIIKDYDLIVDGTDSFPARYLINDACVLSGKRNVYGSVFKFEGQATVFSPGEGPCFRCLYPEPPPPGMVPSCQEAGVFGVLPGLIGMIQATEAIKIFLGIGRPLIGRMLVYDALRMEVREMRIRKDPACPVCGEHPTVTKLIDYEQFCGVR
ncbi:MAG: molybdopterin-synthase adenylyltransferase MoeB [Deltaproteobacteria bacterium]|nr:molybdopterin-synthase adenylyltransferase MoeB [Deltaproteobacteria bacterium]MCL5276440.1 molybdopterin-synthase adenylyltransferase MoeB [Deltaproteobacteria bacterium]